MAVVLFVGDGWYFVSVKGWGAPALGINLTQISTLWGSCTAAWSAASGCHVGCIYPHNV